MKPLRIGSRGSPLALQQSNEVKRLLAQALPTLAERLEIVVIKTSGDLSQNDDAAFAAANITPGVFVKEIEEALLANKIDLAVHSLKDLPSKITEGLRIGAYLQRENADDVLCAADAQHGAEIVGQLLQKKIGVTTAVPQAWRFGTASPRRAAFLQHYFPSAVITPIRGNVETRLNKVVKQGLDGVVLARAGLNRLGIDRPNFISMPIEIVVPAAGQGIVAVEHRREDRNTAALLAKINIGNSERAASAERAFMSTLQAGCRSAVAVHAVVNPPTISVHGVVLSLDGKQKLERQMHGDVLTAEAIGKQIAEQLLDLGAAALLV